MSAVLLVTLVARVLPDIALSSLLGKVSWSTLTFLIVHFWCRAGAFAAAIIARGGRRFLGHGDLLRSLAMKLEK
jgi:hypothetical protein